MKKKVKNNGYLRVIFLFTAMQNLFADSINNSAQAEDLSMWIALFGLAVIAVFALYLSSEEIKAFQKKYKEKEKLKEKIYESENELISKIGESIHDIAKEKTSQTKLLIMTTNLIDFLRIKSKKVQINKEDFTFSNLLNDVSGILKTNAKYKDFELIYDIDTSLSHTITSDTLNLSKILSNILIYSVDQDSKKLLLKVEKNSLRSKDDQIFFTINTHLMRKVEIGDEMFNAIYNDVEQSYENLSLFIAKELAKLMDGELIARNNKQQELEFVLNIPFVPKYDLKAQETQPRKILIIDSKEDSAQHIQKILKSLNHNASIQKAKDTYPNINYLSSFELIFLDENMISQNMLDVCNKANLQVITYYNIFTSSGSKNALKHDYTKISKPFTHWQISNTINNLFEKVSAKDIDLKPGSKHVTNSGNIPVYKNKFKYAKDVSLSNFIYFRNKKVLLVEDNIVNQKVFVGMLGKSKMEILVASNGQEALNILKNNKDIDIIFMDINMPVMDGYIATLHIRDNKEYDNIAIVALTALTSVDEVEKMFNSGMNGYISKPLKKEVLFSVFCTFFQDIDIDAINEETEEKRPLAFEGLDIHTGIQKAASSEVFYKEILLEFKDAYKDSYIKMNKYIEDFRFEQLKILALDVKGLSGTIGANKLHDTATEIIKAIVMKNYQSLSKLLESYKKELLTVITSIDKYSHTN